MSRYARRQDDNHALIRRAFEAMGCHVLDLHAVGNGCPDLLVALGEVVRLVEVKDGSKAPSARRLTKAEQAFHLRWPDIAVVVESLDDARRLRIQMYLEWLKLGEARR